jgi:hypothetical protein
MASPGFKWRELDYSTYAVQLSKTVLALCGESYKGPEYPIEVMGVNDMLNKLGKPSTDFKDYALYAIDNFFTIGSKVIFQRVVRPDAIRAETPYVIDGSDNNIFKCKATSKGSWANDYAIVISDVNVTTHEFDFFVSILDPTGNTSDYIQQEKFEAMSLDPTSDRYIETVVNDGVNGILKSEIVTLHLDPGFIWDSDNPVDPIAGNYVMGDIANGGILGVHGVVQPTTALYTAALDKLKDPETYDFNLIAIPGIFTNIGGGDDVTLAAKLKEICEFKRQDCLAIIDPPKSLSTPDYSGSDIVTDVKTWRSNLDHDSSYTCIWWPWVKILDTYNDKIVWVPASGFFAQRCAYTDNVSFPWFAEGGLNRGVLSGVQDIGYVTNQDERDDLYNRRVNINVIKKDPDVGFVLWGNCTNQSKPSARQQISVRRMLLYLQKLVATSVKYLIFEPNDPIMLQAFKAIVTPYFEEVKIGRGMSDYQIIMDSSTNTPLTISRKEAYGVFKIIPMDTAESINVDYVLYPSGASFK